MSDIAYLFPAFVLVATLLLPLEWLLYGLIFTVLLVPEGTDLERVTRVGSLPVNWYEVAFLLIVLRWAAEKALRRQGREPRTPFLPQLLGFGGAVVIATIIGASRGRTLYSLAADTHVLAFYALFPITAAALRTAKGGLPAVLKRVTITVVLGSAAGAALQLLARLVDPTLVTIVSAQDRLLSRNDEVFVFALVLAMSQRGRSPRESALFILSAILVATKLILSFSRTPAIVFIEYWLLAWPAGSWLSGRLGTVRSTARVAVIVGVVLAAAVGILGTGDWTQRYSDRFAGTASGWRLEDVDAYQQRLYYWPQFLDHFLSGPWLGGGMGSTLITVRPEIGIPYAESVAPDNLFMTLLMKIGILGLVSFLWLYGAITVSAIKVLRTHRVSGDLFVAATYLPILWQNMFLSSMLTHFRVVVPFLVYFCLLGIAAQRERSPYRPRAGFLGAQAGSRVPVRGR